MGLGEHDKTEDQHVDHVGGQTGEPSPILEYELLREWEASPIGFPQKLQTLSKQIVRALEFAVEIKDPFTAAHQRRVTSLVSVVCKQLGLAENQTSAIALAARIHDVGKIVVPEAPLKEPITAIQHHPIQDHVDLGYRLLSVIEFPWPIAQIVRQHHERMDGCGYPLGLSRSEIGLEARVLAVADVFEEMTSHRLMNAAPNFSAALQRLSSDRIAFDQDVVKALSNVVCGGDFDRFSW